MSNIVFLRDMDVCDNEMPVTAVNELPETSADDMENVQHRHVVNGELYPPRQQRALYSENVMPQRPRTAFFTPSKNTMAESVFEALEKAEIDTTEIACLQRKMNGEVTVTFKSISAKEKFLPLNLLQVDAKHFSLQDVDKPLSFLTI